MKGRLKLKQKLYWPFIWKKFLKKCMPKPTFYWYHFILDPTSFYWEVIYIFDINPQSRVSQRLAAVLLWMIWGTPFILILYQFLLIRQKILLRVCILYKTWKFGQKGHWLGRQLDSGSQEENGQKSFGGKLFPWSVEVV